MQDENRQIFILRRGRELFIPMRNIDICILRSDSFKVDPNAVCPSIIILIKDNLQSYYFTFFQLLLHLLYLDMIIILPILPIYLSKYALPCVMCHIDVHN